MNNGLEPLEKDEYWQVIITLTQRQNGRYFADDTFRYIFLVENAWI